MNRIENIYQSVFAERLVIVLYVTCQACSTQKTLKLNHRLNFSTQYNQFYISDARSPKNTKDTTFWTAAAYKERLALEEGILGVGIQSYGHVNAKVILLEKQNNDLDFGDFDHIVEGGLNVSSGVIEISDCPNFAIQHEISVNPGVYGVRIYSSGIRYTDIDQTKGNDHYFIELWPASNLPRRVLKQFINPISDIN